MNKFNLTLTTLLLLALTAACTPGAASNGEESPRIEAAATVLQGEEFALSVDPTRTHSVRWEVKFESGGVERDANYACPDRNSPTISCTWSLAGSVLNFYANIQSSSGAVSVQKASVQVQAAERNFDPPPTLVIDFKKLNGDVFARRSNAYDKPDFGAITVLVDEPFFLDFRQSSAGGSDSSLSYQVLFDGVESNELAISRNFSFAREKKIQGLVIVTNSLLKNDYIPFDLYISRDCAGAELAYADAISPQVSPVPERGSNIFKFEVPSAAIAGGTRGLDRARDLQYAIDFNGDGLTDQGWNLLSADGIRERSFVNFNSDPGKGGRQWTLHLWDPACNQTLVKTFRHDFNIAQTAADPELLQATAPGGTAKGFLQADLNFLTTPAQVVQFNFRNDVKMLPDDANGDGSVNHLDTLLAQEENYRVLDKTYEPNDSTKKAVFTVGSKSAPKGQLSAHWLYLEVNDMDVVYNPLNPAQDPAGPFQEVGGRVAKFNVFLPGRGDAKKPLYLEKASCHGDIDCNYRCDLRVREVPPYAVSLKLCDDPEDATKKIEIIETATYGIDVVGEYCDLQDVHNPSEIYRLENISSHVPIQRVSKCDVGSGGEKPPGTGK